MHLSAFIGILAGLSISACYGRVEPSQPAPAFVEVQQLCNAQGTEDLPLTYDVLAEMGEKQVAGFDAAKRDGYHMTAADKECYTHAKRNIANGVEQVASISRK